MKITKVITQTELDAALQSDADRIEIHGSWETVVIKYDFTGSIYVSGSGKVGSIDVSGSVTGSIDVSGSVLALRNHAEVPQAFTVGIARRHIFRIISDQHEAFEQFLSLVTRERHRKTAPLFHQISVTNNN